MGKLIDGDELIELLLSTAITDKQREYSECVQYAVEKMPPVDAVPVVRGRWRHYEGVLTCSECGMEFYDDIMEYCGDHVPKFCPECGADMRKDGDNG